MTGVAHVRSAGVILYRTRGGGGRAYLILQYAAGHWDFAKGKKEAGEDDMQAALREVREETGIADVAICDGFAREIRYEFEERGRTVHKTVVFFAGAVGASDVVLSDEHQDHAWLGYDDAMSRVTYDAARGVLADADAELGRP